MTSTEGPLIAKTQPRLDVLQMANEGRLLFDGDATYYIRDEFDETSAALCQQGMQVAGSEMLANELIAGDFEHQGTFDGNTLVPLVLTGAGTATLTDWQS